MKKTGNHRGAHANGHPPAGNRKATTPLLTRRIIVSRWGNSLGLRIPREGVRELRLQAGAEVLVEIGAGSITIKPDRKKWTEAELLRGVTPEMIGGEVDWAGPVGKEIW